MAGTFKTLQHAISANEVNLPDLGPTMFTHHQLCYHCIGWNRGDAGMGNRSSRSSYSCPRKFPCVT